MKRLGLLLCQLVAVKVLCVLMTTSGAAQTAATAVVPRLVNFSGRVTQAQMEAAPAFVGITFSIYKEQTGGAPLWAETQNVEPDTNGNYSVQLGATRPAGIPVELFLAGEARWLGVRVNGGEEQPRVLLLSVPYALKAADAETVGGLPASAFLLAPVVNSSSNSSGATANSTSQANPGVAPPPLAGSGTANFVPLWTDSSGTLGNSVLFQLGTGSTAKIGVGTTTPAATLDVKGTGTVRGVLTLPATAAATSTAGKNSQPLSVVASAFNSSSSAAVNEFFNWQSEPVGNNTSAPSASLNLLFGAGATKPVETGLSISSNGVINFATAQTFPGVFAGSIELPADQGLVIGGTTFATGDLNSGDVSLGFAGPLTFSTYSNQNTAVGFQALFDVVLGSGNTAVGWQALYANNGSSVQQLGQASYNTATGYAALTANTTGFENTATGSQALFQNQGGAGNTADGYQALYSNIAGTYNTAAGMGALFSNSGGSSNTAMGLNSLALNLSGGDNTADGSNALQYTTGNNNSALGASAGFNNASGQNNTFLGYAAGPPSGTGTLGNATAIGANSVVSASNAMILGGTGSNAVTVGIGTAAPYNDYALDVETIHSNALINGGVVVNANGGNLYLGMTNTVHKFRVDTNGVTYADGGFQASGADFAESVAVRGQRSAYEPGDVLEIDQKADRHLALSHRPYATLVAGIYSTKPGLLATPHPIDDATFQSSEVPLAVVGIVPCKVSAENGPIARGDLLVTSSRPGYAMKGTDRRRLVGAVVGKALEPLPKGTGMIQVLVTLQ